MTDRNDPGPWGPGTTCAAPAGCGEPAMKKGDERTRGIGANSRARILVVDDERSMREFLAIMLGKAGYRVESVARGEEAVKRVESELFDLVITDLAMPGMDGLEVLKRVKDISPATAVILITAYATTASAVEAMKLGAFDYVIKPFKVDELRIIIENALEKRRLMDENRLLRRELVSRYGFANLVGRSRAMLDVYDIIRKVQDTHTNVLITGESGTGKELVARAIHYNGSRKDYPFVAVNCGAIPENLIESELFGHKRGAFTGAVTNKPGLFQTAEGGTILLDEIAEMPLNTQVKLLRALQERTFKNLGGVEDIKVNVRVLAATNRDLAQEVKEGRFRQDLYYRLNVIQIHLPPLRERMEDLPLLVEHFLTRLSKEYGKPIRGIHPDAMAALMAYDYPGNIRELANILERAVALETGDEIRLPSLPPSLTEHLHPRSSRKGFVLPEEGIDLDAALADFEREMLLQALERAKGVKKRAAKLLNISFRSMRYRLQKHGMLAEDDDGQV